VLDIPAPPRRKPDGRRVRERVAQRFPAAGRSGDADRDDRPGHRPRTGFLQEREALKRGGATLGRALLFFGCRHPDQDYLYREELERYAAEGIVELHVAFSRLDAAKKTYVQHRIAENADDVWSILERNGVIYVCGDGSRMEPDVRATLAELYRRKTGADQAAANAWLDALTASKRYNLDVWGQT
jgi:cytochrome P450/NADPH-cytochrome P450 reductase